VSWNSVEREPPRGDDPLEHLLFRQHQVVSRDQALRHLSANALHHRVRSGRWQHPHRCVYVAMSGPLGVPQRRWIAVLATRGTLAGFSALEAAGLRGYPKPYTEVLIPSSRRVRAPADTVVRRTRHLPVADAAIGSLPGSTTVARALVDAGQWARDDAEAVAVVAAGFQQRLVAGDDVHSVLARMRGVRRERLIREAAEAARGGSESISEIEFLRLCARNGLPEPSRQVVRRDGQGRRRYRDALFEPYAVHVEVDGSQHMEVRAWGEDMRQHNDIAIAGERLLRFTAWQVRHTPADVAMQIRAALTAAGWHPPA
jgi:hypothetical protein